MPNTDIERMRYYQRQFLGAEDFTAEQTYHRDMRRRHHLAHHTWGIVTGLELVQTEDANAPGTYDVVVQPGMAIDGYGREIVLLAPYKLDAGDFASFDTKAERSVWVAYHQEPTTPPSAGYAQCDDQDASRRWLETYQIVIDPTDTRGDVIVDGNVLPPPPSTAGEATQPNDGSVPYQELPDEADDPLWLVRLGSCVWDGTVSPGQFVQADPGLLSRDRQYIGAITEAVLSPVDDLRLARRVTPPPDPKDPSKKPPPFVATVEGQLTVNDILTAKQDALLWGGKLSFQTGGGTDDGEGLWMQRQRLGDQRTLRVHIGEELQPAPANPTAAFTIGPTDGGKEKAILAVRNDDTVAIDTGTLSFGSASRQMVNLSGSAYGLGIQTGAMYFRSGESFCWYRGGKHSPDQNDPGENGSFLMSLDLAGRLNFGTQTRQMLNLWSDQYAVGVQAWTLYFRTHGDYAWYRDGQHSDARGSAGGGVALMKLDWTGNLQVSGPLTAAGNVSTNGQLSANNGLHVSGDVSSVVKVVQKEFAIVNNPADPKKAGSWNWDYTGVFSEVYAVYAMLRGFSIYDNSSLVTNPPFDTNIPHEQNLNTIVQHTYVRVDTWGTNSAQGKCYCGQSDATQESNNSVLFTVIAIGRKV